MWGNHSLQKSKRCHISIAGPSFSRDARGSTGDGDTLTLSPGVFGSSGSRPGPAGWNQPGSQVGAVTGRGAEHTGMRLSAWRQGGEAWRSAPQRLCRGGTGSRAVTVTTVRGPQSSCRRPCPCPSLPPALTWSQNLFHPLTPIPFLQGSGPGQRSLTEMVFGAKSYFWFSFIALHWRTA